MFSASTHVSLVETPTHYLQSARNTVPHYPHEFHDSSRLRFLIKLNKRQNIDDKADQKNEGATMRGDAGVSQYNIVIVVIYNVAIIRSQKM